MDLCMPSKCVGLLEMCGPVADEQAVIPCLLGVLANKNNSKSHSQLP